MNVSTGNVSQFSQLTVSNTSSVPKTSAISSWPRELKHRRLSWGKASLSTNGNLSGLILFSGNFLQGCNRSSRKKLKQIMIGGKTEAWVCQSNHAQMLVDSLKFESHSNRTNSTLTTTFMCSSTWVNQQETCFSSNKWRAVESCRRASSKRRHNLAHRRNCKYSDWKSRFRETITI